MTQLKIIIGLGVITGLLLFFKTKTTFLKVVLGCLSIALLLGYFTELPIKGVVFIGFGITVLIFLIWAALKRKWVEGLIGVFALLSFLWIMLDFPQYNLLQFLMIIPLVCYIWTLIKWKKYSSVISVLTVLAAYEISELVRLLQIWVP